MKYPVRIEFRGKEISHTACLTNKLWYNAVSERFFVENFGETWSTLKKPYKFAVMGGEVSVDKYVVLKVTMGTLSFKEEFFISDALVGVLKEKCDIVIGRRTLEKHRIKVFEE